jgi:uncharacterized protein
MNHLFHRMPVSLFSELAGGGGGREAISVLASGQYSKNMLLLRGVPSTALTMGHCQAPAAQEGYDLLADVEGHDPQAVRAVISYPSVGAWATRTLRALHAGPVSAGAEPGTLRAVAAAAAIRGGFPAEIEVPATGSLAMLPSLGAAAVGGGTVVVRNRSAGAEVRSAASVTRVPPDPHQNAAGWLAVRELRIGSLRFLLDDVDPFRMPAEPTVASRLRSDEVGRWETVLRKAWPLLTRYHPDIAEELAAAIRVLVPLSLPPEGQVSSSSAETFGAVALSQPPDARTLAVTLAHEVQHLKLSALLDMVTLILPDDGRRFYAPWRDDPRPAGGLLQGAYAYVGVSKFWRRQRQLDKGDAGIRAHAEFARWRAAAQRVVDTLQSGRLLTPAGSEFVRGMAETLRAWQDDVVPGEAQELADGEAAEHLARWESANGDVPA